MLRSLLFCFCLTAGLWADAQDTLMINYDTALHVSADAHAPNRGLLVREGDNWSANVYNVSTGVKVMTGYYLADHVTQEGPFSYYGPDGTLRSHGYYHAGKHTGAWKNWDSLGRMTDSIYFENDSIRNNLSCSFWPNNQPHACVFNDSRARHRIEVIYRPDGTKANRYEWQGDKREDYVYWENDSLALYSRLDHPGSPELVAFFSPEGKQISHVEYQKLVMAITPAFPGGPLAFKNYIQEGMKTKLAGQAPGKVNIIVYFMLDENGKAVNIQVAEPVNPVYRQALIENLQTMPVWDMKGHRGWGPLDYSFQVGYQ